MTEGIEACVGCVYDGRPLEIVDLAWPGLLETDG